MNYALLALLALLAVILPSQQMSVAQCDVDPAGHRDSTVGFGRCLEKFPSGDILVPHGTYIISGTIVMNRNQSLIGEGSKGSIIKCLATESPCIVAADTTGGPNNYSVSNIKNLGIEGPGTESRSIGVYLGGDPSGHNSGKNAFGDAVNLIGVRITGFNHGVQWGNNAYANKIVQSSIFGNGTGLYVPDGLRNSGEAIGVTDSNIFNNSHNGVEDHGHFEWMIQGSSFDYNATAIEFYGSTIHVANCHFEQSGGQVFFEPFGSGNLSIRDSEILVQAPTGDDKYILSTWPQSLTLVIDDVGVWSNHPVHYFMRMQGRISGSVTNLHGNGNGKIGAFSELSKTASLSPGQVF